MFEDNENLNNYFYQDYKREPYPYGQGYGGYIGSFPGLIFAPPPNFTPPMPSQQQFNPFMIRRCIGGLSYIWLRDGRDFWFRISGTNFLTLQGYRWGRRGWRYTEINVNEIRRFTCV